MIRPRDVAVAVQIHVHDPARTYTSCGSSPIPWRDAMAMRWRVHDHFPAATGQFFAHGYWPEERHAL